MTVALARPTATPGSAVELAAVSLLPRVVLSTQWRDQLDRLTALSIRRYEAGDDDGEVAAIDRDITTAREMMRSTEAALDRLAHQTYGRCERCGGPIDPLRLSALPAATACRRCDRVDAVASS